MKMKIKKWIILFIAVLGMAFPAGVTAYAYTDEAVVQAAETEPPAETVTKTETPPEAETPSETPLPEEPSAETEAKPFSVEGNGQLLDDISGDDTKQFLTIQTKNGNTFFMVLDRSSNSENVYMLSMIDENDLSEFIAETKEPETEKPSVVLPEETEPVPSIEETKDKPEKETESVNTGAIFAIFLLIAGGVGCYYYFKVVKPKKAEEDAEGEDLEFYDDAYINEDEEADQENPDDETEE
ncbi:hypothetical protein BN3456_01465 [Clostridium sp. C105KSO13]|nr:hypothetical protein BN3456_01465 [Clostridium sp. C105KSO13]